MAGITFSVELSEIAARNGLAELSDRLEDMTGFFKNLGEYMTEEAIPRNFATETAPDGKPWASLSAVTVARRIKKGQTPLSILRATGTMQAQINSRASASQLEIGTPARQAAVMQFGAAKGSFGSTSRGGPIPWGNIPARPFLGFSIEDEQELVHIAKDWLEA